MEYFFLFHGVSLQLPNLYGSVYAAPAARFLAKLVIRADPRAASSQNIILSNRFGRAFHVSETYGSNKFSGVRPRRASHAARRIMAEQTAGGLFHSRPVRKAGLRFGSILRLGNLTQLNQPPLLMNESIPSG
jgi:hypothetical protein